MKRTLGGIKWWQVRGTQGYAPRYFPQLVLSWLTRIYTVVVLKPSG